MILSISLGFTKYIFGKQVLIGIKDGGDQSDFIYAKTLDCIRLTLASEDEGISRTQKRRLHDSHYPSVHVYMDWAYQTKRWAKMWATIYQMIRHTSLHTRRRRIHRLSTSQYLNEHLCLVMWNSHLVYSAVIFKKLLRGGIIVAVQYKMYKS